MNKLKFITIGINDDVLKINVKITFKSVFCHKLVKKDH